MGLIPGKAKSDDITLPDIIQCPFSFPLSESQIAVNDPIVHASNFRMIERNGYSSIDGRRANSTWVTFTAVTILVIAVGGGFTVFWLAYRQGLGMGIASWLALQPPRQEVLPYKYYLPSGSLLPPNSFPSSNESTVFLSIRLLESIYRKQGIDSALLGQNEFVSFSEKYLLRYLRAFCASDSSNSLCNQKGSFNGKIEMLPIAFSKLNNHGFVYPSSDDSYATTSSPLNFTITSSTFTTGISQTKRFLISSGRPILSALPLPIHQFWFPCISSAVSSSLACVHHLYPCNNSFCAPIDISTKTPADFSWSAHSSSDIILGKPEAILIVGYNDHFKAKLDSSASKQHLTGGFIYKSTVRGSGHSLPFLVGELSEQQESRICPDDSDVPDWTPATIECLKSHPSQCSLSKVTYIGSSKISGARELRCISKQYCNESSRYFLLSKSENPLTPEFELTSTGVPLGVVAELDGSSVKRRVIDGIPINFLSMAFQPLKSASPSDQCGYNLIPYSTLKRVSAAQNALTDSWRVLDINANFSKSSYFRSKARINYSSITASSLTFKYRNGSELFPTVEL